MKLEGAERLVLRTLLDLQGESGAYVEESRLAAAARMDVQDVRDWLETLEGKGFVERARRIDGFSAYVTAKGKLVLRMSEPIPGSPSAGVDVGSGSPGISTPSAADQNACFKNSLSVPRCDDTLAEEPSATVSMLNEHPAQLPASPVLSKSADSRDSTPLGEEQENLEVFTTGGHSPASVEPAELEHDATPDDPTTSSAPLESVGSDIPLQEIGAALGEAARKSEIAAIRRAQKIEDLKRRKEDLKRKKELDLIRKRKLVYNRDLYINILEIYRIQRKLHALSSPLRRLMLRLLILCLGATSGLILFALCPLAVQKINRRLVELTGLALVNSHGGEAIKDKPHIIDIFKFDAKHGGNLEQRLMHAHESKRDEQVVDEIRQLSQRYSAAREAMEGVWKRNNFIAGIGNPIISIMSCILLTKSLFWVYDKRIRTAKGRFSNLFQKSLDTLVSRHPAEFQTLGPRLDVNTLRTLEIALRVLRSKAELGILFLVMRRISDLGFALRMTLFPTI